MVAFVDDFIPSQDLDYSEERPKKACQNFWKNLWTYVQGKHSEKNNFLESIITLRNWKKKVKKAIEDLKDMRKMILQNYEVFQGNIYQKFVKPAQASQNQILLNAFVTLMNDRWYYEQTRNDFFNRITRSVKNKTNDLKMDPMNKYK
jgi:hypothetical protein